ncbi:MULTISPECIES: hypothetical protein [unclassified Mycoplasma]|uniref:hypothetical protein n=1 Tax=unclassified Mycoplasma TaxID=2683645 RepID=UPI00211D01A7|nr:MULTISPECIES: hypothetical protein [unclassified Mycoplasma]UUM19950.1 hypothetical protein NPA11_00745 [Mycoplasma sp. 1578d]UUM24931.1 hypothetical protein NPA12_00730 [Mycoplasma sp. 3686d]
MNEKLEKYNNAYAHYSKQKVKNKIMDKSVRFSLIRKLKNLGFGLILENEEVQYETKEWSKLTKILLIIFCLLSLIALSVFIAYLSDFFIYKDTEFDGLLLTKAQRFHGILWRHF